MPRIARRRPYKQSNSPPCEKHGRNKPARDNIAGKSATHYFGAHVMHANRAATARRITFGDAKKRKGVVPLWRK